jgi:arabinose-5-phosphate isomerase
MISMGKIDSSVESGADILKEFERVLILEGQSILTCVERLKNSDNAEHIRKALSLLHQALERGGKIVVTGIGKSGKVGQKITATLNSTGSLAVFLHPTEGLHGDLGVVASGDVILALSFTGNTEELLRLIPSLKKRKIPVIGIGGNAQSKLAQQSDAWIDGFVSQEACPHNLAPTSSTTLALALGDAIAVSLMQLRGFDARAFAKNHPGGSLGNRLNLQVADVMHSGKDLPLVRSSASMDEVVIILTKFKMGAVLVAEGERLLGLVTEGDIRRALQHREKFFSMKAEEVMTRQPVVTSPETMAIDALALMQDRPSQINVLPVVNAQGHIQGLVRLHDIIQIF